MSLFTTNENKGLLWNLMIESNVFGGLSEDKYHIVKELFEKEIKIQSQSSDKNLTEMNKTVLLEVTRKLHPMRVINGVSQKLQQITSMDISQQRQTQFSNNLSMKQREFNNLIQSDKPSPIDFSDTSDDNVVETDIKESVASMIARREQQLNSAVALHNKAAATKWIGLNDKQFSTKSADTESKIAPAKTKVTFLDSPDTKKQIDIKDFFSQLSDGQPDRDQIIKDIKGIYTELLSSMQKLEILITSLDD